MKLTFSISSQIHFKEQNLDTNYKLQLTLKKLT